MLAAETTHFHRGYRPSGVSRCYAGSHRSTVTPWGDFCVPPTPRSVAASRRQMRHRTSGRGHLGCGHKLGTGSKGQTPVKCYTRRASKSRPNWPTRRRATRWGYEGEFHTTGSGNKRATWPHRPQSSERVYRSLLLHCQYLRPMDPFRKAAGLTIPQGVFFAAGPPLGHLLASVHCVASGVLSRTTPASSSCLMYLAGSLRILGRQPSQQA